MSSLALPFAAIGATLNTIQSIGNNRAIKSTMQSVATNTTAERKASDAAAQAERLAAMQRATLLRGSIIASAAERGITTGGVADLYRTQITSEAVNQTNRRTNAGNRQREIDARFRAAIANLRGQFQNPIFSFIQGGFQGAQTGLALEGAIDNFNQAGQLATQSQQGVDIMQSFPGVFD